MNSPRVILRHELASVVGLDRRTMECIRAGFVAHALNRVRMPPVMHLDIPERHAEIDVKTAFSEDMPVIAVKVSTGFFDNALRGEPSLSGGMIALDSTTGRLRAVLLDSGFLTDLRTALAGALACDALARPDASVVAVLGTGVQARLQAEAVALVRPIRNVLVWGRSNDKAIQCATDIEAKLQVAAMAVELEAAVTQADIVVTTTSATAPYVRAEWLKPGVHVTAMGSDAPSKGELDPHCLARADWIVVDDLAQCLRLGEVKSAIAAKVIRPDYPFVVLGDVLGARPPRPRSSRDITVCDLTGLGIQDTAIASAVVTALDA